MAREAAGTKKQRDQLRAAMRDQGCTLEQISAEMARCFGFRARQAWRHTHGWTQEEVAAAYNRLLGHDHAPMTGKRISDFETWPHGGVRPTTTTLAILATLYSTTPTHLVDVDDRQALSPQELIALDTPTPLPATSGPPHCLQSDNSAIRPITAGERATPPSLDTSLTTGQSAHTPEKPEETQHQLTVCTQPPSQHHRWDLILACLLAIFTVIGSAILSRRTEIPDTQPAMPARTASPPAQPALTASGPSSTWPPSASPLLPPLPWQSMHPPPTLVSPTQAAPPPHPQESLPAQPAQPKVSPFSARPDPSGPPAATTASVFTRWKNMHYGLCLDEDENYVTHDPGGLRLWDCNGSTNQMWTEKITTTHSTSIVKNLVSSRTGKCVTYQPDPDPDYPIVAVWLAPCGQDGQGWIRTWNGKAFTFHTSQLHGLCMSVTSSLLDGGFPGIQLRPCDPPSPLTDWLSY